VLFTVTADFSDYTMAVEQYETASPEEAVRLFVETAEAMSGYDRSQWRAAEPDNVSLIHIAYDFRGAWIWGPTMLLVRDDNAMLGGVVVQTDPHGPRRPTEGPWRIGRLWPRR